MAKTALSPCEMRCGAASVRKGMFAPTVANIPFLTEAVEFIGGSAADKLNRFPDLGVGLLYKKVGA